MARRQADRAGGLRPGPLRVPAEGAHPSRTMLNAAAPALYEALSDLLAAFPRFNADRHPTEANATRKARAALAKAQIRP